MLEDSFPPGVAERLKWYVYRLIDPRNGQTFYVGKGKGDRIFAHLKDSLRPGRDEDTETLKLRTIRQIQAKGLEVAHVIHRYGIEDERVAFEIEAALIDAYPGLTNQVGGHGTDGYGCTHVQEIISKYAAEPFEVKEPLILISIGRRYIEERGAYEAVRCAWKIDVHKAKKFNLVLALYGGLVVGAFRPTSWLEATVADFPVLGTDVPGRWGFVGEPAATASLYLNKRVPDTLQIRGARNPVRYIEKGSF